VLLVQSIRGVFAASIGEIKPQENDLDSENGKKQLRYLEKLLNRCFSRTRCASIGRSRCLGSRENTLSLVRRRPSLPIEPTVPVLGQ
jgi:hypothetical protein